MSEPEIGNFDEMRREAGGQAVEDSGDEQMHTIDELSVEMAVVVVSGLLALIIALAAPEGYRLLVFFLAGLFFWISSVVVLWRVHTRWRRRHHRG